jgi:cytoskeletal protein RodZ
MKSFFSLTFVHLVFIVLFGVGGLLWYLSYTTEFSRRDTHTSALPAVPTTPAAPTTAPAKPAKPPLPPTTRP